MDPCRSIHVSESTESTGGSLTIEDKNKNDSVSVNKADSSSEWSDYRKRHDVMSVKQGFKAILFMLIPLGFPSLHHV